MFAVGCEEISLKESNINFVCKVIILTTCYLFKLKPVEAEFLAVNTNAALSTFEKVSENIGME